jgi:hypothetical protein
LVLWWQKLEMNDIRLKNDTLFLSIATHTFNRPPFLSDHLP